MVAANVNSVFVVPSPDMLQNSTLIFSIVDSLVLLLQSDNLSPSALLLTAICSNHFGQMMVRVMLCLCVCVCVDMCGYLWITVWVWVYVV